ncbi:H(+)-transporting V1 sector ATPase subunit H, partial [Coemansia sp. RSA 2603]
MVADVPAAMVSNQFFDEFTDKVRVKPIPWEGFSRAGLVSSDELRQLKEFQQRQQQQNGTDGSLSEYVGLLVGLCERLSSLDALQYLLVMLDDLVDSDTQACEHLARDINTGSFVHAMLRCTERKDDYLGLKACKILAGVVVQCNAAEFAFSRLYAVLERYLCSELTSVVDVGVQVMQSVLRVGRARSVLYEECAGCLGRLVEVLRRTVVGGRAPRGVVAVPQTQYEVVFCLWLLTFEKPIAESLNRTYDVIPLMVEIARAAVKEKVIRIIVATWCNMLNLAGDANVPNMLVAQVPACLQTLATGRTLKDQDLRDDIA